MGKPSSHHHVSLLLSLTRKLPFSPLSPRNTDLDFVKEERERNWGFLKGKDNVMKRRQRVRWGHSPLLFSKSEKGTHEKKVFKKKALSISFPKTSPSFIILSSYLELDSFLLFLSFFSLFSLSSFFFPSKSGCITISSILQLSLSLSNRVNLMMTLFTCNWVVNPFRSLSSFLPHFIPPFVSKFFLSFLASVPNGIFFPFGGKVFLLSSHFLSFSSHSLLLLQKVQFLNADQK